MDSGEKEKAQGSSSVSSGAGGPGPEKSAARRIYILRHAKAEPRGGEKPDYDRELTLAGRQAAAMTGALFGDDLAPPDAVIASSAPRAAQTADIVCAAAGIRRGQARKLRTLYEASRERWLSKLQSLPSSVKSALLIGHNPECEELAGMLGGKSVELKTASLVALDFVGEWKNLAKGSCRLYREHHRRHISAPDVPPQNREMSWLSFNERVLQEATDESVPPDQRLSFLGIVSSNLDEFFRVRVGALEQTLAHRKHGHKLREARKVLAAVKHRAAALQRRMEHGVTNMFRLLAHDYHVRIVADNEMTAAEREFCRRWFDENVRSSMAVLTEWSTGALDRMVRTDSPYLAVRMNGKCPRALLQLPVGEVPRFVDLPAARAGKGGRRVAWLDDVVRVALPDIFGMFGGDSFVAHAVKFTRNAELDDDDPGDDFLDRFAVKLKQRDHGEVVRLIHDEDIPESTLKSLVRCMRTAKGLVRVSAGRYHNLRDLRSFPLPDAARKPAAGPRLPVSHPHLDRSSGPLLDACARDDHLLHFPYHDFSLFVKLLREASIDSAVSRISISVYRLAPRSQIAGALQNALANGKKVFCAMEPRARFDEEANIRWGKALEDAGATVDYGRSGYKTHAKLCLIEREPLRGKPRDIVVAGTGNFNEATAKVYGDMSLITADPGIVRDASALFGFLRDRKHPPKFRALLVSPVNMREALLNKINREIEHAEAGRPARIRLKLNNMNDPGMRDALGRAATAGVHIDMVVRGVLGMDPGRPEYEGRVSAVSIIDRFLEHARIVMFENGGAPETWIGSADWMTRNLDRRVEAYAPVRSARLRKELAEVFDMQMEDNVKARILNSAQSNPRPPFSSPRRRAQADLAAYYRRLAEGK